MIINLKRNFFQELKRYYFPLYKKTYEKFMEYHEKKIKDYLTKGQREGYVKEDINKDLISKIIIEISNMIENSEIFTSKEHSRKELFKDVIITYFRGISTMNGIETIDNYFDKTNK